MRIGWTSDLHADQNPEVGERIAERIAVLQPDVVVMAGDVGSRVEVMERTLGVIAEGARTAGARLTLFVPGNHELWILPPDEGDSSHRLRQEIPSMCERVGVRLLGEGFDPVVLADGDRSIGFAGVAGWYDYSLRSAWLDDQVSLETYATKRLGKLVWNDGRFCSFPDGNGGMLDDTTVSRWMEQELAGQLARLDPQVDRTVVVTHFLPFQELVVVRRHELWDLINAYMGSLGLGAVIRQAPRLALAISGHTHARREARLAADDGSRFLAATSPIGYPRERRGATLTQRVVDRFRVVEV